jgi:hypothetical protein
MSEQDDDGAPAATSLAGFAPAPVSTRRMSGRVTVRSYAENWVGDDSDILLPDREHVFADIDMTAWSVAFLTAVDALFVPDMAAAIAALDPGRAASLAGHKQQLATVIAGTLIPVFVVPGEAPAVEPARALFHQSLLENLDIAYASAASDGVPLHFCPPPPAIGAVHAVTAQSPVSIAEALLWDCVATIETSQAAQDELLVSVTINDQPAPLHELTTMAAAPARSAAATLFDALARMTFEYPQIAPHLAMFSGSEATVARTALERLDALIGDVARTWRDWLARTLPAGTADIGPVAAVDQIIWSYSVDFSGLPLLPVTRVPGDTGLLPPWPAIAGFVTPPEDGQAVDSYQASVASAEEASLTFTWARLPILWAQQVDVAATVRRNANLVPPGAAAGTLVDPAFIYRSAAVHGSAPVSPFADLPSQPFQIGANAATLSAMIDDLLAQLLAGPMPADLAIRNLGIEIDASYRVPLSAGDAPIDSGIPMFLTQQTLALTPGALDNAVPVAIFRQKMIDALIAWYTAMQPDDTGAVVRFAITLSAADAESPAPLAFLGQVDASVSVAQAEWWQ